jgi:hypothetical protein
MNWLSDNSSAIQAATGILTALIWIVYLHALLMNYARQRRPEILITYGAGKGLASRCFVTNLGLEPIYLLDAIVEVEAGDKRCRASVTDREEEGEALADPAQATNQGPLTSGGYRDIGSFQSLLDRARSQDAELPAAEAIRSIEITIVAATAARSSLASAQRTFFLIRRGRDNLPFLSAGVGTRQIRSFASLRRLRQTMERGSEE